MDMDAIYCVQCKKAIEAADVFCKLCGADQRPPKQRPVVAALSPTTPSPTAPATYNAPAGMAASNSVSVPAQEQVSWVWTLIGGSIYFLVKGWWKAALVSFVIAVFTGGLSWFVIPFFAQSFVHSIEGQSFTTRSKPQDNLAALQQLADLHSKGIITEDEYQAKRGEFLRRV